MTDPNVESVNVEHFGNPSLKLVVLLLEQEAREKQRLMDMLNRVSKLRDELHERLVDGDFINGAINVQDVIKQMEGAFAGPINTEGLRDQTGIENNAWKG